MAIGQYGTEWGTSDSRFPDWSGAHYGVVRIFTEVLYQRDARRSNQIDNGGKRRYEKNADDGDQGSDAPGLVKGANIKIQAGGFLGNCMICGTVWEAIADGLEEQVKTGSGRRIFWMELSRFPGIWMTKN